jgi:hypothetical protein
MNEEIAKLVLQGLLERAASDRKQTFLSEAELRAVKCLIGLQQELPAVNVPETTIGSQLDDFQPVVKWLPDGPPDEEKLVCIDFGTSFSKAYASDGDDPDEAPELIGILLSPDAEGSSRYLLPSELLIHQGGIHFGLSARKVFDDIAAEQDQLIDNPKQYMTLSKDVSNLGKRMLPESKDPDRLFAERDALVLYFSHLVRMVDRSLASSGLPDSLSMRYTHPAWKKEIAEQNSIAMRRIVAEAIALARSYPLDFETKLDVRRASKLLVAARRASDDDLPFVLLSEPVAEATAAGAGALMEAQPSGRQHFVILDIGAGTTDVAGCVCVKGKGQSRAKVWEIQSARDAKNLAGNAIDNALQKFILERSSLAKGSTEYYQAERALRRTIRAEKETLFSTGEALVELVTDELVDVSLDDFRSDPMVEKIFSSIKEMVTKAAFAIRENNAKVYLVPTGGGASLPLIAELVSEPLLNGDQRVKLELSDAMPEQLKAVYPEIEPYYPQLAVAIGGAHPALPEQKPTIDFFEGDPGPKHLRPVYTSPHS